MFKKFTAALLFISMLLSFTTLPAFAKDESEKQALAEFAQQATVTKGDDVCPIVFVTGIGQSYSFLYDENGNVTQKWNLMAKDFSFLFKEPKSLLTIGKLAWQLIKSSIMQKNCVKQEDVTAILESLLRYHLIDENGDLPENVVTPLYEYPISEYDEAARDDFFRTIPCQDVIDEIGEDNVYCFNYSAFSFVYRNAENLDDFITNVVLPGRNNDKVVLVPMSMGASVVSAYLDEYSHKNNVAKVVSVVGCWNGSDIFADMMELKYAENSQELVYNGLLREMIGEPWGYVVDIALHLWPQKVLHDIIDEVLSVVVKSVLLRTPSLLALIPSERYRQISDMYFTTDELDYIKVQTDKYYDAQINLKALMNKLNTQNGVEFYFICGYGLGFGGKSTDYRMFAFLNSASKTNSDEIIQVGSTGVGTTYVAAGTQLSAEYLATADAKYISPDKSIDASTSFYPDRTWYFNGQKHELEHNNTAIALAFNIAIDNIHSIEDCKDIFPQFNESRDLKDLRRKYIPELEACLESDAYTQQQKQKIEAVLSNVDEMMARTHNDRDADDAVIQSCLDLLIELGVRSTAAEASAFSKYFTDKMRKLDEKIYNNYGTNSFLEGRK